MINCGNIYLNGKTFVMFFDKENKKRVFYEVKDNEYSEPSDIDKDMLIRIYDDRTWTVSDDIKKKRATPNIKRNILIAGSIVTITITSLFTGCFAENSFSLQESNDIVSNHQIVSLENHIQPRINAEVVEDNNTIPIVKEKIIDTARIELAEKLMSAIESNQNLSNIEKEYLSGYRDFFIDYGHLLNDYNKTIEVLSSVTVEYTGEYRGNSFGGYDGRNNHIQIHGGVTELSDMLDSDIDYVLFHEFGHAIHFSNYDKEGQSANIPRSAIEGVNALVTSEYFAPKADYHRSKALMQVLTEIVDNPEMVINMWLNDDDSEICEYLANITGTIDDAKAFLEKTGILENSERIMSMFQTQYYWYNLDELIELSEPYDSFEQGFARAFNNYYLTKYGKEHSKSEYDLELLFTDLKFMNFLRMTYEENLTASSDMLKEYYEKKHNITIQEDLLASAYFDIIDNFNEVEDGSEMLAAINKPLLNHRNTNDVKLIYYCGHSGNILTADFTEKELSEFNISPKGR